MISPSSQGDYHLNTSGNNACVDTGNDLSGSLASIFKMFDDLYTTEYAYYSDFNIEFNYHEGFDGDIQDALWDIGAY
jgi:hypothetical protein